MTYSDLKITVSYSSGPDSVPQWLKDAIVAAATAMKVALEQKNVQVTLVNATDSTPAELATLAEADGVMIMGGSDIDPSFYGQPVKAKLEYPDLDSDQLESTLVKEAIKNGTPLYGVCRGAQLINTTLGGTLIQHVDNVDNHRSQDPTATSAHAVEILPESFLNDIFDTGAIDIRSAHHQAVDTLGEGLKVAARSEDGLVEAIQSKDHDIFAIQWHPELEKANPGHLDMLLNHFLDRAKAKKK